jgi:hypothetical protein
LISLLLFHGSLSALSPLCSLLSHSPFISLSLLSHCCVHCPLTAALIPLSLLHSLLSHCCVHYPLTTPFSSLSLLHSLLSHCCIHCSLTDALTSVSSLAFHLTALSLLSHCSHSHCSHCYSHCSLTVAFTVVLSLFSLLLSLLLSLLISLLLSHFCCSYYFLPQILNFHKGLTFKCINI